jgi:hypothetical protein
MKDDEMGYVARMKEVRMAYISVSEHKKRKRFLNLAQVVKYYENRS